MKTWMIASSLALVLASAGVAEAAHGTRNGAIAGAVGGAVVAGPVGLVVGGVGGAVIGHNMDKHHHGRGGVCRNRHGHRVSCRR